MVKSQSDLKPLLDVVDTLIISKAERERSFSSMNVVFTPTRNSLLLKTVSHLTLLKTTDLLHNIFRPEGFVQSWTGKGRCHADVTSSRLGLTGGRGVGIPLEWKHCV
jgi:hypothetical protein